MQDLLRENDKLEDKETKYGKTMMEGMEFPEGSEECQKAHRSPDLAQKIGQNSS